MTHLVEDSATVSSVLEQNPRKTREQQGKDAVETCKSLGVNVVVVMHANDDSLFSPAVPRANWNMIH